jgi:hypothetical protein
VLAASLHSANPQALACFSTFTLISRVIARCVRRQTIDFSRTLRPLINTPPRPRHIRPSHYSAPYYTDQRALLFLVKSVTIDFLVVFTSQLLRDRKLYDHHRPIPRNTTSASHSFESSRLYSSKPDISFKTLAPAVSTFSRKNRFPGHHAPTRSNYHHADSGGHRAMGSQSPSQNPSGSGEARRCRCCRRRQVERAEAQIQEGPHHGRDWQLTPPPHFTASIT